MDRRLAPRVVQPVALIMHEDQRCVPKALSEFDEVMESPELAE
jgi:hypothetical protein